jgi:hypothetical protein
MRITDSVYLSEDEVKNLTSLTGQIKIEIQTFPGVTLRLTVDDKGEARWVKS